MSHPVLLDNVAHHDLRYIARYGAEFGDNINQVVVFPTEFSDLQREYPILFRRDDKGYFAVAILGLDADENLYLEGDEWKARYVPALQQRGPFLIGFQNRTQDGQSQVEPVIHVNLDHPRISRSEGDPLFLAHGGNSPRLERITHLLRTIHTGSEISPHMFAAFEAEGLIAPIQVDIHIDEETGYTIPEVYSISAEAFGKLSGDALERLNKAGFLPLAYHVLNSTANLQHLIDAKNRRRAAG